MGLMDRLSNGLSAAGYAGADMIKQEELDRERSQLDEEKAKRLAEFNVNLQNKQADDRTAKINAERDRLAQQRVTSQFAGADAAIADANAGRTDAPLTPEQQDVIQNAMPKAKADAQEAAYEDPNTFTQAAMNTGDINPNTVASLSSKADIAAVRAESYKDRNEMMQHLGDIRNEAMRYGYELRLKAAGEKANNGKIDAATGRMLITSEDANIKAATSQLFMLNSQLNGYQKPEDRKATLEQMDQVRQDIKDSQATKSAYMNELGYPTSADLKKPATPAVPSGTPPDSTNPSATDIDSLFPPKK